MSEQTSIITLDQAKSIATLAESYMPLLREMITNGRKLRDDQIKGRAFFAAQQGLDPISEVNTLTDKDGNTMAHSMHINGYRRKCLEQVQKTQPGGTVDLEFVEMPKEKLPSGAYVGFECRLRDSVSYHQWQQRILDLGKTLKEVLGSLDYPTLIQACGPAPVYTGIGIVYSSELSEWKDKNFNPLERAKKRAEANARKRRFPTNAPITDDGGAMVSGDVIDSQWSDTATPETPAKTNGKGHLKGDETTGEILGQLYGEQAPAKVDTTYTREEAARDLGQEPEGETVEGETVEGETGKETGAQEESIEYPTAKNASEFWKVVYEEYHLTNKEAKDIALRHGQDYSAALVELYPMRKA